MAPGAEAEGLLREIAGRLESLQDPVTGQRAVSAARPSAGVYRGPEAHAAPDLLVGYAPGYRASWTTVLGGASQEVLSDNRDPWSGDHAIDPDHVPGVFLCRRSARTSAPALQDLAPTILREFGLPAAEGMTGQAIEWTKEA